MDRPTVSELGERGVLARVLAELGAARAARIGPGDDCAVLEVAGDLVVSSDTMIEGTDFRLDWHGGFDLGWKLAATNLSDVAAMGARPTGLTVSLACPRDTPAVLLQEIARGLDAACRELAPGCGVVGGDLGAAPVFVCAVTAVGELAGIEPVTRGGAQPGDAIAYAGQLGLAGDGLRLLFEAEPVTTASIDALRRTRPAAISAQLSPHPPIGLGRAAALAGARAMMDVSDGLLLDAERMAAASEVRIGLSSHLLLAAFGTQEGERVPLEMLLRGGEDHGLLAAFPDGARMPAGFERIGRAEPEAGSRSRVALDGVDCEAAGWDPYRPPSS